MEAPPVKGDNRPAVSHLYRGNSVKSITATLPNGEAIVYVDRKRLLWLMSVLYPLQPLLGIGLHAVTAIELWLLLPLLLNYGLGPVIDGFVGVDANNPPDEVVMQLDQDPYYRRLTYATVPLHFVTLLGAAWYTATQDLSGLGFVFIAAVTGLTSGLAINTGHELGHKNSRLEKVLAKSVLALLRAVVDLPVQDRASL